MIERLKNLPTSKNNSTARAILLVVCIGCALFMGYMLGVYQTTGTSPFTLERSKIALPPADPSTVTTDNVQNYLEEEKPTYTEYGVGFNCVESAILAARDAAWKGMQVEIFRLVGTNSIDHMLIGFPMDTGDWIFVEPQTSEIVDIQVGSYYMGEKITEIYILRLNWELFSSEGVQ